MIVAAKEGLCLALLSISVWSCGIRKCLNLRPRLKLVSDSHWAVTSSALHTPHFTPFFSVYSSEKMGKEKEKEDVDDSLQFQFMKLKYYSRGENDNKKSELHDSTSIYLFHKLTMQMKYSRNYNPLRLINLLWEPSTMEGLSCFQQTQTWVIQWVKVSTVTTNLIFLLFG